MKDWRRTTLGELVAEGSANYQTGPFGTALKAAEYSKEGVPLISVGEIREGYIQIHASTPRVCEKITTKLPKYVLKEEDIVFGRKGAINRNAIIQKEQSGWFLGSDGIRLRLSDEHSSSFFSYQLRTASIKEWLMNNGKGAIMPSLNQKILDRLPVYIPELHTQQKIAKVLSTLDAKIELNNQINGELEAMAKLLYDYWFVQFDFPMTAEQATARGQPELEGKPYKTSGGKMVFNQTLKREIPEGWEVEKLLTCTDVIRRGVSPKYVETGGVLVLNQKCIRDQKVSYKDARRHGVDLDESNDRLIKQLDVLVNSTGVGTLGRVAFVKRFTEKKTTVDSHVTIVRPNSEVICPSYLVWTMLRSQPHIEAAANGSTGQVELSKSFLEDLDVIIPNTQTQNRFKEFVAPIIKDSAIREEQNQELTQLRDWLLPMLMNGQVTVNDSVK